MSRTILIFLSIYCCLGLSPCKETRVRAYLDDKDTNGTNIRKSPNGEVLFILKDINDEIAQFDILEDREKWLYIEIMEENQNIGKKGWIYGELVGIDTRNYQNEEVNLYSKPDKKSQVVNHFTGEHHFKIYRVCGSWAYVHSIDEAGNVLEGWLEPEMQCGNPYTNCS